jgi:hypothetical protein
LKPVLFAAAVAAIATAAYADTLKDASFKVTPGQYHWVQNSSVAGIPLNEDNTECLTPEQSNMTLSNLARKLQKTCTVDNVVQTADGYSFKLVCAGKYPGSAEAKLVKSDKAMAITADGSAKMFGIPAAFTVKADATYVGACTPEQLQKAADKAEKAAAAGKN